MPLRKEVRLRITFLFNDLIANVALWPFLTYNSKNKNKNKIIKIKIQIKTDSIKVHITLKVFSIINYLIKRLPP